MSAFPPTFFHKKNEVGEELIEMGESSMKMVMKAREGYEQDDEEESWRYASQIRSKEHCKTTKVGTQGYRTSTSSKR